MKVRSLFFLLIVFALAACKESHEHDGVYISQEPIMGVTKAWIVEGNAITSYLMGEVKVARCKQYDDHLESDDITYPFDEAGNLIIPGKKGRTADEKLIKRSAKTKVTAVEIEKLIDEFMPPPGVLKDRNAAH
jgi:hypothetical protein